MLTAYIQSDKFCIYINHKSITIRVERIMKQLAAQSKDERDMFGYAFEKDVFERVKIYLAGQGYVLEEKRG